MKTLSYEEILEVLDREIKKTMEYKNRYIELNGFKHVDDIKQFDSKVAAYTSLYYSFKVACGGGMR